VVCRLTLAGWSVGQCETVTVDHGNRPFDLTAMALAAVSPAICLSQALCTAGAVFGDRVAAAGAWVPD